MSLNYDLSPAGTVSKEPRPVSLPIRKWIGEIAAAQQRDRDWVREGKRVKEIYDGKQKDTIPFNILYSNTETLLPALFSLTPRPVVQRRFKDADPMGKAASTAVERLLAFLLDTNSEEYAGFDEVIEDVVLDALLPGRGAAWLSYDVDTQEVPADEANGLPASEKITYQSVCFESLKWDRWVFGYAKTWAKVPWVGRQHDMTKEECIAAYGEKIANQLSYSSPLRQENSKDEKDDNDQGTEEEIYVKTTPVWEIWDRVGGKKIRWISSQYPYDFLKVEDDRLQLTGFFPMPEPLQFLKKSNDLQPTALYTLYENQAKELNNLTVRINKVVSALKVRGAYDATLSELGDVLSKGDNELVPAQNVAALEGKGLTNAIWLMPLNELVLVLQQLLLARDKAKEVIYEITGISDILRGASVASETATAQNIKNQWGTLRLKRMQKQVQNFVRELLRIMTEIGVRQFTPETMAAVTGLPYTTPLQAQQAKQELMAAQQQAASFGPPPQVPPGQQPPPPPPGLQQAQAAAQQAQQALQAPQWVQILELLRNDLQREYRIDIETNSTIEASATEDQQQMSQVLGAVSQFLQGVGPLIMNGTLPFEAAQAMLLGVIRKYRMGPEIEQYIEAMRPPAPPQDNKGQADQQKSQIELQVLQVKAQTDTQLLQQKAQIEAAKHQAEMEKLQAEKLFNQQMLQIKMMESEIKLKELQAKTVASVITAKQPPRGKPNERRQ